jgi:uridine kinase
MTTTRRQVLGGLADRILALRLDHPIRVGIDGHSAAGKTTLADELATTLRGKTVRPVLRITIDHFKRHVDLRTQYPPGSPESYYFEMFDVDAIRDELDEWSGYRCCCPTCWWFGAGNELREAG